MLKRRVPIYTQHLSRGARGDSRPRARASLSAARALSLSLPALYHILAIFQWRNRGTWTRVIHEESYVFRAARFWQSSRRTAADIEAMNLKRNEGFEAPIGFLFAVAAASLG